jgi:hypothetical protein
MTLSDTALIVLTGAAKRDDRLVPRRTDVPPVVDVNACRALVKHGLIEMIRAPLGATDIVTVREDDSPMVFVIADAGFRALSLEPPASAKSTTAAGAPTVAQTGTDAEAATESAAPADAPVVAPEAVGEGSRPRSPVRAGAAQARLRFWRRGMTRPIVKRI